MKVTLAVLMILVVITFTQTPNPIPLPSLNLTKVQGLWYIVAGYPNYLYIDTMCYAAKFTVLNNTTINVTTTTITKETFFTNIFNMTVSNNGSIWSSMGDSWVWISFDPVNGKIGRAHV